MLALLFAFMFLNFALVFTRDVNKRNDATGGDICVVGAKNACSGHGKCMAFLRNDKKKATRCNCTYPWVGDTCSKKRLAGKPRGIKHSSESSGSDGSGSVVATAPPTDSDSSGGGGGDDDSKYVAVDTDSSEYSVAYSDSPVIDSDENSGSDSEANFSDSGDDDDGHHEWHSGATWWALALLIVLILCFCIPAILWCVWRQKKSSTGRKG